MARWRLSAAVDGLGESFEVATRRAVWALAVIGLRSTPARVIIGDWDTTLLVLGMGGTADLVEGPADEVRVAPVEVPRGVVAAFLGPCGLLRSIGGTRDTTLAGGSGDASRSGLSGNGSHLGNEAGIVAVCEAPSLSRSSTSYLMRVPLAWRWMMLSSTGLKDMAAAGRYVPAPRSWPTATVAEHTNALTTSRMADVLNSTMCHSLRKAPPGLKESVLATTAM
eukprot:GILK01030551.1.p2 GENE.GILK01030551.1~~GILK01030551.1.p2  ORF type:complete len:223 (+),score=6.58 GILK01030551.1:247-915(+)